MKLYWAVAACLLGTACTKTDCAANLTVYKKQVDQALSDKIIDGPAYDDQQRRIGKIDMICAQGNDQTAISLLLDAAIALNIGADDAHARASQSESDPTGSRGEREK